MRLIADLSWVPPPAGPTFRDRPPPAFSRKPARPRASPWRRDCRLFARETLGRPFIVTKPQLDAISASERAAEETVGDQGAVAAVEVTRPSKPAWAGPDRSQQPRPAFERRVVEPQLQASLVGDLDAIEQIGPARVVPQGMRIGSIDQVTAHVDRRDRTRAVGPVKARPDLESPADGPDQTIRCARRAGRASCPDARCRRRCQGSGDKAAG